MERDVILRLVRSDGAQFVIDETDWGAIECTGLDAVSPEIFSESRGVGDGSYITGKRISARDIEFAAQVMDSLRNDLLRWRAVAFFNPKHTFRLYATYMGRTRWIEGELTGFQCAASQIDLPQTLQANLTCPDPYMKSVDDFGQDIAAITPRHGWPFMDHPDYGMIFSTYNYGNKVNFDYDGDVPCYAVTEITADNTVVNPSLRIGDGFVRVLDTMQAGDVIVVDSSVPRITKNGQNIIARVDRTSRFTDMQISPGNNTFSFGADVGENEMHVTIRYYKNYLGV